MVTGHVPVLSPCPHPVSLSPCPALYQELRQFRSACADAHMKTILAVGDLDTFTTVYKASLVAMMAGQSHGCLIQFCYWGEEGERNRKEGGRFAANWATC